MSATPLTPLRGLDLLESQSMHLKPNSSFYVLRASGAITIVRFRDAAGRRWSNEAGDDLDLVDDVVAVRDVLWLLAGRLAIVVGRLTSPQWREALLLALNNAGGPADPYSGRYNGKQPAEITEDWIERLAAGGRVEPYGSSHVVTGR